MNTLQKKIMRRVYYAYALRTVSEPVLLQGFFMLALMIALTYFVSIGNIIANMKQIEMNHLGVYFYNAVTNTEAWTLLIIGAFIFSVLSLRFTLGTHHSLRFAKVPS